MSSSKEWSAIGMATGRSSDEMSGVCSEVIFLLFEREGFPGFVEQLLFQ